VTISILDLFKIGIGPSSSHTVGPMRAARRFVQELEAWGRLSRTESVKIELYGSLALTGKGHGTDRAILLGLTGEVPDQIEPNTIELKLARIREQGSLRLLGTHTVNFDEAKELVFKRDQTLPNHSNGMKFTAYNRDGQELDTQIFYSIGGGFIASEGEPFQEEGPSDFDLDTTYPFRSAAELLSQGKQHQKLIWEMMLQNETTFRSAEETVHGIFRIWNAMKECTWRGLKIEGVLPGGLQVPRRAPRLYRTLAERNGSDPLAVVDWINLFAIAVNEENAAGGRVVTAPTNGAAGVLPAVAHYYQKFVDGADDQGIVRYFLTAGAIGILYKENASISGAEVGCQGEVGVACSMAAGGLVAALGGTNEQVEHAAEIGMEHNLGMTCDPIGGLVQIPCIERNAFGAVKAVNAARMAMSEMGDHKVSLDQVIRTMHQTGKDMQARYKETSLAGLAVNVIQC
jgi:L-serine dehydratase